MELVLGRSDDRVLLAARRAGVSISLALRGFGIRVRQLSLSMSKQLLEFGSKPMILDQIQARPVTRAHERANHKHGHYMEHRDTCDFEVMISRS